MERGYEPEDTFISFPLRVVSTGHKTALKISLKANVDDMDLHCSGSIQGFKLILHTPSNMPKVAQAYIRIPVNTEVLVSVKPNIITTTGELRKYDPIMYLEYFFFISFDFNLVLVQAVSVFSSMKEN